MCGVVGFKYEVVEIWIFGVEWCVDGYGGESEGGGWGVWYDGDVCGVVWCEMGDIRCGIGWRFVWVYEVEDDVFAVFAIVCRGSGGD